MKDFQAFLDETKDQRNELFQQSISFSHPKEKSESTTAQLLAELFTNGMNYSDNQLRLYHEWLTKQLSEQSASTDVQEHQQ